MSFTPTFTDLSDITRQSDKCKTVVSINLGSNPKFDRNFTRWVEFGQANFSVERSILEAFLEEGVYDFEHDSCLALRLPLIGVELASVDYHWTELRGWVDPNNSDDFHVPRPEYNPAKHPKAVRCKCAEWQVVDAEAGRKYHTLVPDGFYIPPFDAELYEAVRGKPVKINLGIR